jgi:tetratricopeptide (TPR) repeat protein
MFLFKRKKVKEEREDPGMDAQAYRDRGLKYVQKGRYDKSIADFTRAVEIDPLFVVAYMDRASAYTKKGEYEQAILDYTRVSEINPGEGNIYFLKAFCLERVGRKSEAIETLESFIKNAPPGLRQLTEIAREQIKKLG